MRRAWEVWAVGEECVIGLSVLKGKQNNADCVWAENKWILGKTRNLECGIVCLSCVGEKERERKLEGRSKGLI